MAPIIIQEGGSHHGGTEYYGSQYHPSSHGHHHSSSGGEYYVEERPHRHHSHGKHHHHRRRRRWRDICCPCLPYRIHSTTRYRFVSVLSFIVLFSAFLLFLLVSVSIPLIKPIYLLQLGANPGDQPATSVATNFRFGVWGYCASSALNLPTILTNNGECTSPRIGWTLPSALLALAGFPTDVTNIIQKTLTVLLVLHPVSAGLAFLTMLLGLFLRSQYFTVLAVISSVVTAIVASIVLAADLALGILANRRIHDEFGDALSFTFGNGVWMMVAAVALTWLGVILLSIVACRCCGVRRKHGWYGDGFYYDN